MNYEGRVHFDFCILHPDERFTSFIRQVQRRNICLVEEGGHSPNSPVKILMDSVFHER